MARREKIGFSILENDKMPYFAVKNDRFSPKNVKNAVLRRDLTAFRRARRREKNRMRKRRNAP